MEREGNKGKSGAMEQESGSDGSSLGRVWSEDVQSWRGLPVKIPLNTNKRGGNAHNHITSQSQQQLAATPPYPCTHSKTLHIPLPNRIPINPGPHHINTATTTNNQIPTARQSKRSQAGKLHAFESV